MAKTKKKPVKRKPAKPSEVEQLRARVYELQVELANERWRNAGGCRQQRAFPLAGRQSEWPGAEGMSKLTSMSNEHLEHARVWLLSSFRAATDRDREWKAAWLLAFANEISNRRLAEVWDGLRAVGIALS